MTNREDSVLDEIDRLVDESLARGDRSDSFHGNQYREDHPCPWCDEGYHYLAITENMRAMRMGSYARDEFGQGIVDPDYSFEEDTSAILCPGSEFHGPPFYFRNRKLWGKQSRERAQKGSGRQGSHAYSPPLSATLPPGRLRRLRFYGPFTGWTVALEDERIIEDIVPGVIPGASIPDPFRPRPVVREQRLTATFEPDHPIGNPSPEWMARNIGDIEGNLEIRAEGTYIRMKPITFEFRGFEVYADSPNQLEPTWMEFETTYPIERHDWFMRFWSVAGTEDDVHLRPAQGQCPMCGQPNNGHGHGGPGYRFLGNADVGSLTITHSREGYEFNYVVIDESHEMSNERLRQNVEDARSDAGQSLATQEAPDEEERG